MLLGWINNSFYLQRWTISNRVVYECSGQRVCWIRGTFFIGFVVSQTCTTMPGCPEPPGCNSWLPPIKIKIIYVVDIHI